VNLVGDVMKTNLRAGTGVYAYYFPEVRKTISDIARNYPHRTFLKSISPGLDSYHKPIIAQYLRKFGPLVSGLDEFKNQYPNAGSSEAIFHQLVKIKVKDPNAPIYVLNGEYQGYQEYAKTIGLKNRQKKRVIGLSRIHLQEMETVYPEDSLMRFADKDTRSSLI
jgi:hypothetical protein